MTAEGTTAFVASRSSKVLVLIVVALMASLNVAVTAVVALTPVAPPAGDVALTVGGVVSGPVLVVKTTSTQ